MDRIDLFVQVPRVDYEKLAGDTLPEASSVVRDRVSEARRLQWRRFGTDGPRANAAMPPRHVREFFQTHLADEAAGVLKMVMSQLSLSARAFHRVLKVARTVADLAGSDAIGSPHVLEAIQYRRRNAPN